MVDPHAPHSKEPTRPSIWKRWVGMLIGSTAGLALWLVIALVTESPGLGLVFGLLPGLAIGVGLDLTRRA